MTAVESGGPPAPRLRGRIGRIAAVVALVAGSAGLAGTTAAADGPTTFSNTAAIAIPATGSANQEGQASPYPSPITVTGLAGLVTNVKVAFNGLTHSTVNDIDAMVVAPGGANLVVLSDIGDAATTLAFANNATLTFDDAAAGSVPTGNIPTGSYRPTNTAVDAFPSPAPAPSSQTTLAGAFTGISPNGTWQLFVVDDNDGDVGTMAGGWSLIITTEVAAVSTTTVVTTSGSPSTTGGAVTFTATVSAGGSPVTAGSVQFTDGPVPLGAPVALNASGIASVTTSALSEGTHEIRATFGGSTGFLASNGTVAQRVDNQTLVTGNTFCNTGPIAIPAAGAAQPYPSNITVSGSTGNPTKVTAALKGVSHAVPVDFDILLAGPVPSTNLVLLSDAGGTNPVSGVDLAFDDDAAGSVPTPMISGTFKPTDDDTQSGESFPAPAPAPSSATALSTFNAASANGTWSLWVHDDATADSGSISGGWCLTITTTSPTATTLIAAPNPSNFGDPVTFTATVTAGGAPVTTGTVAFTDNGSTIGGPVTLDASGTAALTTSVLTAGTHPILATYSGATEFLSSSDDVSQVVNTAATTTTLIAAPNPSNFGDPVTFTATVTAGGAPVTTGTVAFTDNGSTIGGPVTLDASGTAALTTSVLTAGTHPILATYSGATEFLSSSDDVSQVVNPIANAGGPYTVAEGGSVTLDGTGSTPGAQYQWFANGDLVTDPTGLTPTLSWDQLEASGVSDGPLTYEVALRVIIGGLTVTTSTALVVTNTAPAAVVTGSLTATVGQPFTVKVGAEDPSSADMLELFDYTLDWGDGSPVEVVRGTADPPVTHTYTSAGTFAASFTATDKDGGTGEPTTVQVQAVAAPVTTPPATTSEPTTSTSATTVATTAPPTSTTATATATATATTSYPSPTYYPTSSGYPYGALPATGFDLLTPALLGGGLLAAGAVLLVIFRRRRSTR